MKKIISIFILAFLILPCSSLASGGKKKALYFYADACVLCDEVDAYFQESGYYDKYEIKKIEVSGPYNMEYLNEFFDLFGINPEKRGWPVVIFGTNILIGSKNIKENFHQIEIVSLAEDFPNPSNLRAEVEESRNSLDVPSKKASLNFSFLLGAAVIDSVNPCAFAVFIILLFVMIASRHKRKALIIGLLFTVGIFLAYFYLGVLSPKFASLVIKLSKPVSITMGIISLIIGVLKLRELFNIRIEKIEKFALWWRARYDGVTSRTTNPLGALMGGFLASLFLIPCASKPYLVTVESILNEKFLNSILILLAYDLIFILPMLGVVLIIYYGTKSKKLSKWENENARMLHAIMGAVMVFVGIYLIQNWI